MMHEEELDEKSQLKIIAELMQELVSGMKQGEGDIMKRLGKQMPDAEVTEIEIEGESPDVMETDDDSPISFMMGKAESDEEDEEEEEASPLKKRAMNLR